MHRSNAAAWFPAYSQFESTEEAPITIKDWSNQLRSWHTQELLLHNSELKSTGRKSNSRYKKRPVAVENPHPLQRAGIHSTSADTSSRPMKRQAVPISSDKGLESDETAFAFLCVQHGGHEYQAAVACLVGWTREKACRTIRRRQQQTQSHIHRPMEDESSEASVAWRDTILETVVAISGHCGHYLDETAMTLDDNAPTCTLSVEELQATWKAVLMCGDVCLKQVRSKERDIYVSAVSCFLQQAAKLPPAETVFAATTAEEIGVILSELNEVYLAAKKQLAQLLDLWGEDGVEVEVIRKLVETTEKTSGLVLDEMNEMKRQVAVVSAWQSRLEEKHGLCNITDEANDRSDLSFLEELLREGRAHGLRCRGLIALEQKVERVYSLQNRILKWKRSCKETKETIKFISAIARDIHRLKVRSPIVNEMLLFQQAAESWVERANIAIRSRISLSEIKTLVERGREMPLDLKEYLEKLHSRIAMATDWLGSFQKVVLCEQTETATEKLELIRRIRAQLNESGQYNVLYELATVGSRIPVEIESVKLLQVELDARSWSLKAKKWITDGEYDEGNRRGKLEELREHVSKASVLRERLALPAAENNAWVLDGESELTSIVSAADDWLEKYQSVLDGGDDDAHTIDQLRKIVQKGSAIHVNVGPVFSKFSRILAQAESWFEEHYPLFIRCNLGGVTPSNSLVQLQELKTAISAASSDVSVSLKESKELKNLVDKIESWLYRASVASGQKRQTRGKTHVFTIDDLTKLIDEANAFPVDTKAEVVMLQEQYRLVQEWQLHAVNELKSILVGFKSLREAINETYGPASKYKRDRASESQIDRENGAEYISEVDDLTLQDSMDCDDDKKSTNVTSSQCDASISTSISEQDMIGLANLRGGDSNIHSLIKSFCNDANFSCILTPETESASELKKVSRWCLRSLKYIKNSQDIFDKRFFGAFDRFVAEGRSLLYPFEGSTRKAKSEDSLGLVDRLRSEWLMIVSDQLERLAVLLADRKEYVIWCNKAENILNAEDRRPTLEKLNELAAKSREFPVNNNLVQKVQTISLQATAWAQTARQLLASTKKMSYQEAKTLLAEGDDLGFTCDDMKCLRNGLKTARGWSNRVKRCKVDQGTAHHKNVQTLIEEHKSLLVDMTDEATELKHAMKKYCLCRRPYEGFMIGCDECEDWFHGSCVGISESRADRVNKFVCLRCSLSKTYKASALEIVDVIRKWISKKDLKRIRQVETQKHKRKVRKEKKEIENYQAEAAALRQQLDSWNRAEADETTLYGGEVDGRGGSAQELEEGRNSGSKSPPIELSADMPTSNSTSIGNVSELYGESDFHASDAFSMETASDITADVAEVNEEVAGSIIKVKMADTEAAKTLNLSRDNIQSRLNKIAALVQEGVSRLARLTEAAARQKRLENMEDKLSSQLRKWVVRVRSLVLVPSTLDLAALSRPKEDGFISDAMLSVVQDAKQLGVHAIRDVSTVLNCFNCLSWCLRAMSIFARQPSSAELVALTNQASLVELPDEKAIRVMRSMAQRVAAWENKVLKTLTPVPEEVKPFNIDALKDLATTGDDIPVYMPLEQRLTTVIDDGGCRHCLCGGPSDGRFMVGCDQCDRWFHGHCVLVDKNTPDDDLTGWKCPTCQGRPTDSVDLYLDSFHDKYDVDADDCEYLEREVISSKVFEYDCLWPPFGLFSSANAQEVLGGDCCAIPDCVGPLTVAIEPNTAAPGSSSQQRYLDGLSGNMLPAIDGEMVTNLAFFFSAVSSSETDSTQTMMTNVPTAGIFS